MSLIQIEPWPEAASRLTTLEALAGAGEAVLSAIAACPWHMLPADAVLCRRGEDAAAAYLLMAGGLLVLDPARQDTPDQERVIGYIDPGELVGEMALLTSAPRSATVRARRDSVLIELPRSTFQRMAAGDPGFSLAVAARVATRLMERHHLDAAPDRLRRSRTLISLVPLDPGADMAALAGGLLAALARGRRAREVTAPEVAAALGDEALAAAPGSLKAIALAEWLLAIEEANEVVLLLADAGDSEWTRFCLRQADVVLMAARGAAELPRGPVADRLRERPRAPAGDRREIVLLHSAGAQPRGTARWLDAFPVAAHHHVRLGRPDDLARLARRLTHQGIALALSGGAARGAAHLGVLQVLAGRGVPIDHASGTSLGALCAAFTAAQRPLTETVRAMRTFFTTWFLDAQLPWLSALSGERLTRFVREHFADTQIEDLWLPFTAMASRLNDAQPLPLRRGPVAEALRCSLSVPGLYTPVSRGADLLVDGLFTENLPARRSRDEVQGYTLAVNVIPPADAGFLRRLSAPPSVVQKAWGLIRPGAEARLPPVFEIVMQSFFLSTVRSAREAAREVDCYIEPAVGHIGFLDSWSMEECIKLGEAAAVAALDAWLSRSPEVSRLLSPGAGPR